MPYIHIQISGEQSRDLAARVTERAVELTATILGKSRALTAVVIDFIEATHYWSIGGLPLSAGGPRSYHWEVTITDETNTKREKALYLHAVHEAMGTLLGGVAEHSYAHVADLRGSAYGYGGRTQEDRYQHPS
jgi:4-oxalocrotonate tautomerase